MERTALLQILHLRTAGSFFPAGSVERGNKFHPAEKPLLQRIKLVHPAQLVQQDDLRREGTQSHLHRLSLGYAAEDVERKRRAFLRGEYLSPLVDDGHGPVLFCKFPGDTSQKGRFAAVGFPHQEHPDKSLLQNIPEFLWQRKFPVPGNADIHRAQLLQDGALPRCAVKLSGQPGAAPTAERDIARRNFCLVAVYRPAAEGDEYLFHLQGRQPELLQSRQLRRAAGLSADGQLYSTADPEAYLMYLFCNARRQGAQRPCQPCGQSPNSAVILVHLVSPSVSSFWLLAPTVCGGRVFRTQKRPTQRGHPLHEPFESILFKLPVHPAAWQGILPPSAQVRRGPVPWSVWSLLLCQPQRKPSFWRLSRWLCRRF